MHSNNTHNTAQAIKLCEEYRKQGYACSESVFRGLSDIFEISTSEEIIKALTAFSGGAARDDLCGAFEGGMIVLGVLWGRGRIRTDMSLVETQIEFQNNFAKYHNGSLQCSDIFYPLADEFIDTDGTIEDFHCAFWSGMEACCYFFENVVEVLPIDEINIEPFFKTYSCGIASMLALGELLKIDISKDVINIASLFSQGHSMGYRCSILESAYFINGTINGRIQTDDFKMKSRDNNLIICDAFFNAMGASDCKTICNGGEKCSLEIWKKGVNVLASTLSQMI